MVAKVTSFGRLFPGWGNCTKMNCEKTFSSSKADDGRIEKGPFCVKLRLAVELGNCRAWFHGEHESISIA